MRGRPVGKPNMSAEEIARTLELGRRRVTPAVISAELGRSQVSVRAKLKQAGIPDHKDWLTDEERATILRLDGEGKNARQIGAEIQRHHSTVSKALKLAGVVAVVGFPKGARQPSTRRRPPASVAMATQRSLRRQSSPRPASRKSQPSLPAEMPRWRCCGQVRRGPNGEPIACPDCGTPHPRLTEAA